MDKGNIQIFNTAEGGKIEIQFRDNTIWLDAHLISNLFDVQRPAICQHINNIYKTEELEKNATCSILEQVAESHPAAKNMMIMLVVNLLANNE